MKKKILLIEDSKGIRESVKQLLQLDDYAVVTAANGKDGVELALSETPDLILCDVTLPELDGYGVLHLLAKNAKTSHIPFIFLTAKSERTDFRKGMEMGAEDYLTKPFDNVELLNAIEARFRKIEARRNSPAESAVASSAESATDIAKLIENREVKFFTKKQLIYKHGYAPQFLYYINKGKVKTFKLNADEKKLITAIYKEGDWLGYRFLLEDISYTDSAEALEDTEITIVPKQEFVSLAKKDVQLAQQFIHLLSQEVARKEEQLLNTAYNSLRKRIAVALLAVNNIYKKNNSDKPQLEITRENFAQLVGTATESIIRILSDFQSEKLIEIKEGKIIVLNEAKLDVLRN